MVIFQPIVNAILWLGRTAFTGGAGKAAGAALMSGAAVLLARASIALVTFGIIATATGQILDYALAQSLPPELVSLMAATGISTGLNIMISTMQGIIAIRVLKVGFIKVV